MSYLLNRLNMERDKVFQLKKALRQNYKEKTLLKRQVQYYKEKAEKNQVDIQKLKANHSYENSYRVYIRDIKINQHKITIKKLRNKNFARLARLRATTLCLETATRKINNYEK